MRYGRDVRMWAKVGNWKLVLARELRCGDLVKFQDTVLRVVSVDVHPRYDRRLLVDCVYLERGDADFPPYQGQWEPIDDAIVLRVH